MTSPALAFYGRDLELAILDTCLSEALAGDGRLVWISGEPGIGKTRLAEEVSRLAAARGAFVAWGRSWEAAGTPAHWLWIQVLRRLAAEPSTRAIVERARLATPELDALLGGPQVAADPEQARFRLFDGVARVLREAAMDRPLLLVLDDLHAADENTLSLVRFVARDLRGSRVLLVGTARDTTADEGVAAAAREGLHVPLGRLRKGDIARWVEATAPGFAADIESLFTTSEGHPLFVVELLAAASKRAHATRTHASREHGAGARQPLPISLGIRGAIRAHLALVSDATRALLETASVLGREVPLSALGSLTSGAALTPGAALEEALDARLLEESGEGIVRFSHVLIRDELEAGIEPLRRAALHREAARWFAREGSQLAAAHHHLLGARAEDAAEIAATIDAAMREASMRLAFEDAARLGERASTALAPHLAAAESCRLQLAIGEAWVLAGRTLLGQEACVRAAETARSLARPDLLARATLAYATEQTLGRQEPVVRMLRDALAALGEADSPLRAEVLARLSLAVVPIGPGEGDEAARLRREAIDMARRLGAEGALFIALRGAALSGAEDLSPDARLRLNAEAIDLARKLGELTRVVPLFGWQIACRLELGDPDGAATEVAAATALLQAFPQPHYRWRSALLAAMLDTFQGRFADAEMRAREVRTLADTHRLPDALVHLSIHRLMLQLTRGDAEGYAAFEPLVRGTFAATGGAGLFSSLADAVAGNVESARATLAGVEAIDTDQIPGVTQLGWVCVWCDLTEHAAFFYQLATRRLPRLPLLFGPSAMGCAGPTALLAGRLATMLGLREEAESHLRSARDLALRLRGRPFVAQAELAWAELLREQNPSESRAHAEAAAALAGELGMPAIAARAQALSAARGVASVTRSSRPLADGLPREGVGPKPSPPLSLQKRGDTWSLAVGGKSVLLRDTKGLAYLAALIAEPHRDIHVLELVGGDDGDAGPLLDAKAKRAYRARAEALREDLDEATRNGDRGRIERARAELDALGDELSRAVGLGGRDRRAGSLAERARINVQRRLRDVIRKVAEHDAHFGRHLESSVKTGVFCVYAPTWPA